MNNQSVQPNLVLSLTSHPPRFPFLLTQLNRVSKQTLFPDLLVLNIAEEDYSEIPKELAILDLPFAFEINLVENLGPGTKLIPTLIKYPTSTIITIDDDIKGLPRGDYCGARSPALISGQKNSTLSFLGF